MELLGVNLLLLVCAAVMGFLVPRGTTCAVAAVGEAIERRRAWRFGGFALAALIAICVLLPLSWSRALPLHFASNYALSGLVALGGFLFGVGAAINGACVFGTLTKIVSGDTSYLFVLLGLWLGVVTIGILHLDLLPSPRAEANRFEMNTQTLAIWGAALAAWLGGLWWFIRGKRAGKAAIMSGIGLAGGLLYTLHPYWNYSSIVHDFAQDIIMAPHHMGDGLLPWLVVAACAGGFASTWLSGQFKLKAPKLQASLGAIIGGVFMAFGVAMIPGGNDALVLFLLPSLVPAGLIAYAAMNLGIAMVLAGEKLRDRLKSKSVRPC